MSTIKLLTFKKAFHALYPLKIEQTAAVQRSERAVEEGTASFIRSYPLCYSARPWIVVVEGDAGGQVRHRRQRALAVGGEVGDEGGGGLEHQHFLSIRVL